MPPVSRSPFSLYKKKSRSGPPVWYARYWNYADAGYSVTRSTGICAVGKRERRPQAEARARAILPTITFKPPRNEILFLDYVEAFWTPSSNYVKERALISKKPLANYYIQMNHDDVRRHLRPFAGFASKRLQDVSSGIIMDWMRWAAESGLGARRINSIVSAMRVAVRYAVKREELPRDPFLTVQEAHEDSREKGILSRGELHSIIELDLPDIRLKAAMLLAALCGLRRGEVRGLQWQDVDFCLQILTIQHNYVSTEGSKLPKNGSSRKVPLPSVVKDILEKVKAEAAFSGPEDFVLSHGDARDKPLTEDFFRYGITKCLKAIGISEKAQRERNITFHGLRHTFVTLGRMAGLSDLVIQNLAGHKSAQMMEHYSHVGQVIDFSVARKSLEESLEILKTL